MFPKISCLLCASVLIGQARLHHVHLNSTDPPAAVSFYVSKFEAERRPYRGADAVFANGSWLLFEKVSAAPRPAITSGIWHIGWGGGADMRATYEKQLAMGSRFQVPLTDLSDQCDGRGGDSKFLFAYVDGPDHALIELNTTAAGNHRFGHLHLLSEDPIAAGEWYVRHFGLTRKAETREPRSRCGRQTAPNVSLLAGEINVIIYPVGNARVAFPEVWKDRVSIDSSAGHAIDHFAFAVGDVASAVARLRLAGVKVLRADGRSAMIEGPDRVVIELLAE